MKVELRGQHDLGQIVGLAYRMYARNFVPLFLIAAVTIPLQLLIGVIQQNSSGDGAQVRRATIPSGRTMGRTSAGVVRYLTPRR